MYIKKKKKKKKVHKIIIELLLINYFERFDSKYSKIYSRLMPDTKSGTNKHNMGTKAQIKL